LDSDSPRGPRAPFAVDDPLALAGAAAKRAAAPPTPRPKAPPPPLVRPAWKRGRMRIAYELRDKRATVLVVTINSPDEQAPPTYEAFAVSARRGTVTMDVDVDPAPHLRHPRERRDGEGHRLRERPRRPRSGLRIASRGLNARRGSPSRP